MYSSQLQPLADAKKFDPAKQLEMILSQYENQFKSNPETLRNAIPTDEIWRLFIDGERQSAGWIGFERTEPGYLHAMLLAFQKIFEPATDLNKFSIELHKLATDNVLDVTEKNNLYRDDKSATEFFIHSKAGVECLLQYISSYLPNEDFPIMRVWSEHGIGVMTIYTPQSLLEYYDWYRDFKNLEFKDSARSAYLVSQSQIKLVKDPTDVNDIMKPGLCYSLEHCIVESLDNKSSAIFYKRMDELITQYKHKLSLAKNTLDKLRAILEFIQAAERLHPFSDGNTRTFSMLLLNHLLIKNGMPLVIRDNPNNIYAATIDELLEDVICGMQRTFDLTRGINPYQVVTQELIKKLTVDEKKHFNDMVLIEANSRKSKPCVTVLLSPYKSPLIKAINNDKKSDFDSIVLDQVKKEDINMLKKLNTRDAITIFHRLNNIDTKTEWIMGLQKLGLIFDCDIEQIIPHIRSDQRLIFASKYISFCINRPEIWVTIQLHLSVDDRAKFLQNGKDLRSNKPELFYDWIEYFYNQEKTPQKNVGSAMISLMDKLKRHPILHDFTRQEVESILCRPASVIPDEEKIKLRSGCYSKSNAFFKPQHVITKVITATASVIGIKKKAELS